MDGPGDIFADMHIGRFPADNDNLYGVSVDRDTSGFFCQNDFLDDQGRIELPS